MTVIVEELRYARVSRLLWRDTGRHVLVLMPRAGGQVLSIGGGGAAVWRLLDRPRNLRELHQSFVDAADTPPDLSSLATCLDQLSEHGIVRLDGETA